MIAGCDGFHGVCRPAIPARVLRTYERDYPYGWLGILAAVAPSNDELVYSNHERGFALLSLRSPELSRLYLQCRPDEDLAEWPDERIWAELQVRLGIAGWTLAEGPVLEKGVTGMRSFVVEPMSYGRLYLAGDAAHIVPPTGAKGLNLAIADVKVLAEALITWFQSGRRDRPRRLLDGVPAPRVARRAVLLLADLDAPPRRGGRRVRPPPPGLAAAVPDDLDCGCDHPRRELRRARDRLSCRHWRRPRGGLPAGPEAAGESDPDPAAGLARPDGGRPRVALAEATNPVRHDTAGPWSSGSEFECQTT